MAKTYRVKHAFAHGTGKDRTFFTRANEAKLAALPPAVLEHHVQRGNIEEVQAQAKEQERDVAAGEATAATHDAGTGRARRRAAVAPVAETQERGDAQEA